ncbi:MAG: hypothetical protein HXY34_07235 [Candidatus Thorarchaeota archaeon]|nr:hypothetical protein [Candidatus Thorarchaeota archaeon]
MHGSIDSTDNASNERILFLFNARHGLAPYSHAFIDTMMDVQVLSGFVSAILSFMQEALGSSQKSWKTEYGSDSTLLVEAGDWIVGVLAVSRVTSELRSRVRSIVKRFEKDFAFMKDCDGIEGGIYTEFDSIVRHEFVDSRVSERSIFLKRPDWVERGRCLPPEEISQRVVDFMTRADDGKTLGDVSAELGMNIDDVTDCASQAVWHRLASMVYVPSDEDLLSLSEGSSSVLLGRGNPANLSPDTLLLLSMTDGRSELARLIEIIEPADKDATLRELGILLNKGYVQRESFERILVFVTECIVSSLLISCGKYLGVAATEALIRRAMKAGSRAHPWIGRISVDGDLHARCRLDDTMSPTDLDDTRLALIYLQDRVFDELTEALGQEKAEDLVLRAQAACYKQWAHLMDPSLAASL